MLYYVMFCYAMHSMVCNTMLCCDVTVVSRLCHVLELSQVFLNDCVVIAFAKICSSVDAFYCEIIFNAAICL